MRGGASSWPFVSHPDKCTAESLVSRVLLSTPDWQTPLNTTDHCTVELQIAFLKSLLQTISNNRRKMQPNMFQFTLVVLFLLSGASWAYNTGGGGGGGGGGGRRKVEMEEVSTGPNGATSSPIGGARSEHGPNWDYSWGWGSSPGSGWGYGSGSGRSPNGVGRGFGFGFGSGSGSGSGSGYGSGWGSGSGGGDAHGGGYGSGTGSGGPGDGHGGTGGGSRGYGNRSPSFSKDRNNHG